MSWPRTLIYSVCKPVGLPDNPVANFCSIRSQLEGRRKSVFVRTTVENPIGDWVILKHQNLVDLVDEIGRFL